ncbi:MAG: 50S ribosomal protein L24 [Alphaproteobacteria bacterium]|nr:50S ribosomal protein L24 [Alphaproteobacteria bacterium]
MQPRFKIKKGDEVVLITGPEKGKRGKVLRMLPLESRAIVEGVNMVKRHTRPRSGQPEGGIVEKEGAVHLSNLALVDPKDGRPTRVGYRFLADGRKVRFAKRSGEVIDA